MPKQRRALYLELQRSGAKASIVFDDLNRWFPARYRYPGQNHPN